MAKTQKRRWTKEEDALVRLFFQSKQFIGTTEEFAKKIGRTRLAVSLRGSSLGVAGGLKFKHSDAQKRNHQKIAQRAKDKSVLQNMSEGDARKLFSDFQRSSIGITAFSKSRGFYKDGLSILFRKFFPDEFEDTKESKAIARDKWYRLGRSFEYQVRNALRDVGWWVMRSPGSKSPIDLVAIKQGQVVFIQCKRGQGTLLAKEKKPLMQAARDAGVTPVLACRPTGRGIAYRICEEKGYRPWKAI